MPLASWGGGGDPSSTFAILAQGVEDAIRAATERLDDRREAELAGQDEEFFARYQAGKVSDDEWLDYIRRRRAETDYDPEQSAAWRKAELEWTEKIADDRAQTAFERTGDYGDYIGYLQGKLRRTKDSDGRLAITAQIRQLQDGQAQRNYQNGMQRIINDIGVGKATDDDLLRFLRETRRNLRSGSPLATQVLADIGTTQARIKTRDFEGALANLNYLLSSGQITPKEAGIRRNALLAGSDLMQSDPVRYYAELDTSAKLIHSPDPAKLAQLQLEFQTGAISAADFETRINLIADLWQDYDPTSAIKLRMDAIKAVDDATSGRRLNDLANPGQMTIGKGGAGFQWISQMDGSALAALNCTMASGAMLAYAMGYKGLSGGDLRFLSGDTAGGTNITQLYNALNRAGVDTSDMDLNYSGTFEQFKKQIGNGRSSVIVGDNARIGADAKASASMNGMHAWLVADYDPKKDAFLVFNSAIRRGDARSKKGYWVSADTMQAFGFSGRASGSWLASPRGTARKAGGKGRAWHVIDVETPPQRPDTPRSYKGRDNPGISGSQRGALRATGHEKPLDEAEYGAIKNRYQGQLSQVNEVVNAYLNEDEEWNGQPLTPAIMDEVVSDYIDLSEEAAATARDNDDPEGETAFLGNRSTMLAQARQINSARTAEQWNTLMRDSSRLVELSQFETDPAKRAAIMRTINGKVQAFVGAQQKKRTNDDPLDDLDKQTQGALDMLGAAFEAANDPNLTLDEKRRAINDAAEGLKNTDFKLSLPPAFNNPDSKSSDRGDTGGNVLTSGAGVTDDERAILAGEKVMVILPLVDTQTGIRTAVPMAVPVTGEVMTRTVMDPATGQKVEEPILDSKGQPMPVPDLSAYPDINQDKGEIAFDLVPGTNGPVVMMVATYREPGRRWLERKVGDAWVPLTDQQLDELTIQQRRQGLASGELREGRGEFTKKMLPGHLSKAGFQPAVTYVRDDGIGGDDVGTGQWYQDRLPTTTDGDAVPDLTDIIGVDRGVFQLKYAPRIQGQYVNTAPGVDPVIAQAKMNRGELGQYMPPPEEQWWRGMNGERTQDQTFNDSSRTYWNPAPAPPTPSDPAFQARVAAIQPPAGPSTRSSGIGEGTVVGSIVDAWDSINDLFDLPGGSPIKPRTFDPAGAVAGSVMGLAEQFGIRTPRQQQTDKPRPVNPVLGRNVLRDSLKPRPTPSSGAIPRPTPTPVGERAPTPPPKKKFVPPSPVKTIVGATAGIGKQPTTKKTYTPAPSGGFLGRRPV